METLRVALDQRSYPILIGPDLLTNRRLLGAHITASQVLIVSNDVVAPLYLQQLTTALADRELSTLVLPDGEAQKTLANFALIMDTLVEGGFHRDSAIVALGGGVIGDLAGFAAACYQRGISYAQVPTTLLAQVDSSVGGKTAVNHPGGKNLIGAFHQPNCVIIDTTTLKTLPTRELTAGLAEIIKYGLILDADFFGWLEDHMAALKRLESPSVIRAIQRSCAIKAAIVAEDERESGRRTLLNLGHTFGHAIEAATGYGEWLHGEAVGVGLLLAARLSELTGTFAATDVSRTAKLVAGAGLPTSIDGLAVETLLDLMAMDKKTLAGRLRLVVLRSIGESDVISDPPRKLLEQVLREYGAR